MDNDEFKKPLTILVTPGMAEYLTAIHQRALELARNDNFVRIEAIKTSLPINQIARPKNMYNQINYGMFEGMTLIEAKKPAIEVPTIPLPLSHKTSKSKYIPTVNEEKKRKTCAKNKKKRKRKNR
jgi:hypothetical protein